MSVREFQQQNVLGQSGEGLVDFEGFKLHRRKQVSGSTVNRELTLLKHMFNLSINWDLYAGSNPL